MKKILYFVILINTIFCGAVFAQIRVPRQDEERYRRQQEEAERRYQNLHSLSAGNIAPVASERKALPFKLKRTGEQKKRLSPSQAETVKYAEVLRQPKTYLIKIFPDFGCEENANIIRADEICLKAIPNSAFYSFREREHTNEYLSDLRFKNGFFVSDGVLSHGILTSLGDVSLEDLTLQNVGLKYLSEFAPEVNGREVLRQSMQLTRGFKINNFEYKKFLPAVENTTYALRTIAYRGSFWRVFRGIKFDVLEGDDRSDLIVAFRVVGKSEDGSLTLLWKELERKKAPKIVFPRGGRKT